MNLPPPAATGSPCSGTLLQRLRLALDAIEASGYALLRAGYGLVLFTHGWPKLRGEAHGSMADPMAGSVHLIGQVMGLPWAPQLAVAVMLLETFGALMLVAGLSTRWVALAVAGEMAGICLALGPTWPWIDRGIEYPVLLGLLALYFVLRGGGRHSIDGWWQRRHA